MEMSLSEICAILGDHIEQYNSANIKRKGKISDTMKKLKFAKMQSQNKSLLKHDAFGKEIIFDKTPRNVITESPVSSLSFSSVTRIPSQDVRNRRNVRRPIIIQPKRLTFDNGEN